MNRKNFLSGILRFAGVFVAGTLLRFGQSSKIMADDAKGGGAGGATVNPAETPCETKVKFAKAWVKRFMNVMDRNLDEKTRKKIMESCGKECFCTYNGTEVPPKQGIETLDMVLQYMQNTIGKENAYRDGNKVYYNYVKNPKTGLKIADGYCLCPLTEDGPEGLSPTYCMCSTGYVKELFERYLGKPVKVEILESLRRGGKDCRFLINI